MSIDLFRILSDGVDDTEGKHIRIAGEIVVAPITPAPLRPDRMTAPSLGSANQQVIINQPSMPQLHGAIFIEYRFRICPLTESGPWAEFSAVTFPRVVPATNELQYVQQAAVSSNGQGDWSLSATVTPAAGAGVPAKMAMPTLEPGNGFLRVDLAEGTANGGSDITSEDIRHAPDVAGVPGTWVEVLGWTDGANLTLPNDVDRWVASRSNNAIGNGDWSDPRKSRPTAVAAVYPTPDVTIAFTGLVAKLNEWDSPGEWNATAAGLGKAVSDERFIAITSGAYGAINLNGYRFPARVTIMSANPATLATSFTSVMLTNCTDLGFAHVTFTQASLPASGSQFDFDTCIRPFVNYSRYLGPAAAQSYGSDIYSIYFKNGTAPQMIDTLVLDGVVGVYWHLCTDPLMRGCLFNNMKGDDSKAVDNVRLVYENNWSSLTKRLWKQDEHVDYHQEQTANTGTPRTVNGVRYRGHVTYLKVEINKTVQGLYTGGQGIRNDFTYEDCVIVAQNGTINFKSTTTQGTGNSVTRVTGLYPGPCLHGGSMEAGISGKAGTKTNCIQALKTGSAIGGTGCVKIDIGNDKPIANGGGYAAQNAYFVGPIQAKPSTRSPIHELKPLDGAVTHWNHTTPVGGYVRMREIYEDGLHPGNSLNAALAAHWQQAWNWDGAVTT